MECIDGKVGTPPESHGSNTAAHNSTHGIPTNSGGSLAVVANFSKLQVCQTLHTCTSGENVPC
jgi:hypothetical protein